MAGIAQGAVYSCNLGPVVGRELSGPRNALVLSTGELHEQSRVAVVVPASGSEPPRVERGWHRPLSDVDSWASVRQLRTVPQSALSAGILRGHAQGPELVDIRQRVMWHFLAAARFTHLNSAGSEVLLRPGTLITTRAYAPGGSAYELNSVLASCRPDGVANVFVTSDRPRPNSRLAVEIEGPDGLLTVLPHQTRLVDLNERFVSVDGLVDAWSIIGIKARFLDLISLGQRA